MMQNKAAKQLTVQPVYARHHVAEVTTVAVQSQVNAGVAELRAGVDQQRSLSVQLADGSCQVHRDGCGADPALHADQRKDDARRSHLVLRVKGEHLQPVHQRGEFFRSGAGREELRTSGAHGRKHQGCIRFIRHGDKCDAARKGGKQILCCGDRVRGGYIEVDKGHAERGKRCLRTEGRPPRLRGIAALLIERGRPPLLCRGLHDVVPGRIVDADQQHRHRKLMRLVVRVSHHLLRCLSSVLQLYFGKTFVKALGIEHGQ